MLTWEADSFAYAQYYDEQNKRYVGLHSGSGANVNIDINGLIVKPEIAIVQMEADRTKSSTPTTGSSGTTVSTSGGTLPATKTHVVESKPDEYHRFYGTVKIDPLRIGRDTSKIADEVIQLLTKEQDSDVEITLEIRAVLPKGTDEKLRRDVTENCRTLKFNTSEFEKS